jgi:lysophospholipase L1-like esterase
VTFAARCLLAVVLVTLSACGDSGSSTTAEPDVPIVATLGDSITAGAPRWSPNPQLRAVIASRGQLTRESQWQYWAGAATDGAFRFRNCGVEGDRTDEIEARFAHCTAGADVVVIQGGTNDLAQGRTPAEAAGNIDDMVRRAERAGLRALVTTIPPRPARVPVVDFFGELEDPRRPDRMPARWTADGIHPTVEGYGRLGRAAARELQ